MATVDDFDYPLPSTAVAQSPATPREAARLLVAVDPAAPPRHATVRDLPELLEPGDLLVVNETRVLPARLRLRKATGGEVELLFLRDLGAAWEVLARPSRRLKPGTALRAGEDEVRVVRALGEGRWVVEGDDVSGTLARAGRMPLPPYIRPSEEAERAYQTVYARNPGSAAAPTAGFHFTERVLQDVEKTGIRTARVTLHVGTGTFSPVRTERLEEHRMHAEYYSVPEEAARAVREAGRVVAAGTTVARTLESWAASGEREGESTLFVYPGYEWKVIDALLTNFHLPRSTLLAMVMSFGGQGLIRQAYRVAVEERYRFYSFGDAMLILNGGRAR